MQNKNFLKLSLYECKLKKNAPVSDLGNFKISISFNSKTCSTDKINISQAKFKSGKFFYFEIPNAIEDKENITISAIGTSWMFFNSIICSGEINYKKNLSIFNDKKFWFTLKNKENQEIMQIFISIWTEYSILGIKTKELFPHPSKLVDISLFNEKSSFINNSCIGNVAISEKNEIKSQKENNTTMIRTQRDENKRNINTKTNTNSNISSKVLFKHIYKDTNPSSFYQDNSNINNNVNKTTNYIVFNNMTNINNKNKTKNNINNRNINNNSLRNNYDNSSLFNVKEKDNFSVLLNGNNISYLNIKENNPDSENNKIEYEPIIQLITKYEKEGGDKNIVKKLWEQVNVLKEKEKNLDNQQIKFNEGLNKLKEKNKILDKERQQLDLKIAKFKKEQNEYEQKNLYLSNCLLNFENNLNDFNKKKSIEQNNKEIFYNLNYYICTGNNIPLNNEVNYGHKYNKKIILTNSNELIDSLNT